MKTLAPFIPILGIFITGYYMIIKLENTGIEDYSIVFYLSGVIQAFSLVVLTLLICVQ